MGHHDLALSNFMERTLGLIAIFCCLSETNSNKRSEYIKNQHYINVSEEIQ